jgi:hypothetical protein
MLSMKAAHPEFFSSEVFGNGKTGQGDAQAAPGGSFIWPTRAIFDARGYLMNDSAADMSLRSLPSRVRSRPRRTPTRRHSFLAMLLINSMMTTVLPTPAPPNTLPFHPRNGQSGQYHLDAGGEQLGEVVGPRVSAPDVDGIIFSR